MPRNYEGCGEIDGQKARFGLQMAVVVASVEVSGVVADPVTDALGKKCSDYWGKVKETCPRGRSVVTYLNYVRVRWEVPTYVFVIEAIQLWVGHGSRDLSVDTGDPGEGEMIDEAEENGKFDFGKGRLEQCAPN